MQETLYFIFCKYSIIKTQVNCNFDILKSYCIKSKPLHNEQ